MSDDRPQIVPVAISPGLGSFVFDQFPDGESRPLTVHYFWPKELDENASSVFVMHGLLRNGECYRDRWKQLADEHRFLLIVPEFDHEFYPEVEDYNLAGLVEAETSNKFNLPENWAFRAIELLFRAIRFSTPFTADRFRIYGHSAGAQFVHRLVLFHPDAGFDIAVAANAGWYTLPCQKRSFPYGVANAPVGDDLLGRALQRPLVILLGEEDNDDRHQSLRRTPGALEQGDHRLARGRFFFEMSRSAAKHLDVSLGWRIETIPKAEHRDSHMSVAAVEFLLGRK